MDSSSGSMQSSNGGEDEYDSRAATAAVADSIPPFLVNNPHFLQISNPDHQQPSSLSHHHHHHHLQNHPLPTPPFFFDPAPSNFLQPFSSSSSPSSSSSSSQSNSTQSLLSNSNSFLGHHNQDPVWARSLSNCTELGQMVASSSSPFSTSSSLLGAFSNTSSAPLPPLLQHSTTIATDIDATRISASAHPLDQPPTAPPRSSSKKRTRASRRAPTTVLTTDTSNFRAMVQEFTGVPAAPFSAAAAPSPYSSRRLDLFASAGSAMRSIHSSSVTPQLPPLVPTFHKRPLAQKSDQLPPPSLILKASSSGFVDAADNTSTKNASTTTNANDSMSSFVNYQNLVVNMQSNPPVPKFNPLFADNVAFLSSKAHHHHHQQHLMASSTSFGSDEQLGLGVHDHNHVSGFPFHHETYDRSQQQLRRSNHISDHDTTDLITDYRVVDGNTESSLSMSFNHLNENGGCKLNSTSSCAAASSSPFSALRGDKGSDNNLIMRSEGTLDSWICNPSV